MKEKNNVELIAVDAVGNVDDIIALAERRIHHTEKLITLSLQKTNENDWVDQAGKPYLTGAGAEKIARLWGVKIKNVSHEKIKTEDENGPFYYYQYTGTVELPGGIDSIEAIGTCSSKDQFFAKSQGVLKPLSEIDETNINKSAYTNMLVNGITRLLGIRNLTWEEVEAGTKFKRGDVQSVQYNSGGKGGTKESQWSEEQHSKAKNIGDWLIEICNGDVNEAANTLERLTTWEKDGKTIKGKRSVKYLTGKQIDYKYDEVKTKYESWLAQNGGNNDGATEPNEPGANDDWINDRDEAERDGKLFPNN